MIKKIIVFTMMICLLFLNSCKEGEATLYNDDGQKADARLKQVIEAIKDHDKDALRSMFSQKALNEAEDLDGRMDYLFGFVQGDIKSWDSIVSGAVDESTRHGHVVKESRSWYTLKTDKEEYLFFLYEYTEDTENPENVGLYMLQVIKSKDKDTQFDGGGKILCAGIYKPSDADSKQESVDKSQ